jgi:exportin-T
MRGQAIKDIVAAWYNILVAYEKSSTELCNECLDNVKRYISWIDINLIVNDTFLPLFFRFLTVNELREKSCECIFEVWSTIIMFLKYCRL